MRVNAQLAITKRTRLYEINGIYSRVQWIIHLHFVVFFLLFFYDGIYSVMCAHHYLNLLCLSCLPSSCIISHRSLKSDSGSCFCFVMLQFAIVLCFFLLLLLKNINKHKHGMNAHTQNISPTEI